MSNSSGFWEGVTVTPRGVTQELLSYRGTPDVTPPPESSLLDAYKGVITYTRALWRRVPTAAGNPSKGPRYFAVTMCSYENEYGMTSSSETKGVRWACKTCFSFAPCVWADGPAPDREEQEQEWADWAAKQTRNGQAAKTRARLGIRGT